MTKLEAFMDKLITDFGGAALAANVMLGDEPGQYRAVADSEPVTPTQMAARTGCRRTMASSTS